ncbi:MAG: ABC transporter ATP-binding protein [Cellulosilyticaceae bacterium]
MISIRGLTKMYGKQKIYEGLDASIEHGKVTAVMGPSGCGKTTLLRILAGLEPYEQGQILGLEDQRIGMVFQEDRLIPWLTVEENIQFVVEAEYPISELLTLLGLGGLEKAKIHELSGGMQRRVSLGRALAYEGDILLMDEPFKGIDEVFKRQLMEWLRQKWVLGQQTVLWITHDLEEAKFLADHIWKISDK